MSLSGSIVYLHGMGGVRPDWARPLADTVGGAALTAPTYADLLRPDARLPAGKRYAIVVTGDGKVEGTVLDR